MKRILGRGKCPGKMLKGELWRGDKEALGRVP